jgi:uncharacterized protein DUF4236
MRLRFFRRFRLAPGLTLNLSKRGVSVSVGARGAHLTIGTRGMREAVGIPGTGLYLTAVQPRKRHRWPRLYPRGGRPSGSNHRRGRARGERAAINERPLAAGRMLVGAVPGTRTNTSSNPQAPHRKSTMRRVSLAECGLDRTAASWRAPHAGQAASGQFSSALSSAVTRASRCWYRAALSHIRRQRRGSHDSHDFAAAHPAVRCSINASSARRI